MNPRMCDLWLMEPARMSYFVDAMSTFHGSMGHDLERKPISEVVATASSGAQRPKAIGLVRIHNELEARPSFWGQEFGLTSYEAIGAQVDALAADESVGTIVLDIMSPGGMVYGAPELAEKLYQTRNRKPIIALANPMAASGAYWLAAAADRIVATPSADVGSVGVINMHSDMSKMLSEAGITTTVVRSQKSPYKAEANSREPLTEDGKGHLQARADAIYERFVGDLARFRGVTVDYVNEKFGQGRMVDAQTALRVGMIDRIDTLQGVIEKLMSGRVRLGKERAMDNWDAPTPVQERRERVFALRSVINDLSEPLKIDTDAN